MRSRFRPLSLSLIRFIFIVDFLSSVRVILYVWLVFGIFYSFRFVLK